MENFFNNLNSFHESLLNHEHFGERFLFLNEKYFSYLPSFRCESLAGDLKRKKSELNVYLTKEKITNFINNFYFGLIESIGKHLWNLEVCVEKVKSLDITLSLMPNNTKPDLINCFNSNEAKAAKYILGYRLKIFNALDQDLNNLIQGFSNESDDFCVSLDIFNSAFPFTILIDRNMDIRQVGDGLLKNLGNFLTSGYGLNFFTYFLIENPKLNEHTFQSLYLNQNMNFRIKMKSIDEKNSQLKDMELKGSMNYVEETDCLLFIGSPIIKHLEELTGRGLYISDIPIHDATRDLILVGEQTKAQVKKMNKNFYYH